MNPRPILWIQVALEERPELVVLASTAEDEQRLLEWLSSPAARRRLHEAIDDALYGLGGIR